MDAVHRRVLDLTPKGLHTHSSFFLAVHFRSPIPAVGACRQGGVENC